MFTKRKCIMVNKIIKKENIILGLKINLISNYFMNFKNTINLQHNLITSCIFLKITEDCLKFLQALTHMDLKILW